ncbi:hypothetical protein LOC71_02075 [Rhodopirellula sp. JC740]|uniref:Transmembrane protein n=1 Tax=Rhodopirellula halodulae TaxID=2894198 RepID=A0ABS8NBX4_9BACT|nr:MULTISPECIES: hypothetical protein [unclassified Rhodopirellula]MCC9641044.1 hypothetical protein [Rhodopirellula sp. JC740]MCC9655203.1 hypothetical protein [Rhodopirellula sp. JC737]
MFAGGLILACTLIGFAIWLQRSEQVGWSRHRFDEEADRPYMVRRWRSRRQVNFLFLVCGVLILVATLASPARRALWLACWSSVMLVLVAILFLAGLDALRTVRHMRHRMNELKQTSRDSDT